MGVVDGCVSLTFALHLGLEVARYAWYNRRVNSVTTPFAVLTDTGKDRDLAVDKQTRLATVIAIVVATRTWAQLLTAPERGATRDPLHV